jgi:hypothetical protein
MRVIVSLFLLGFACLCLLIPSSAQADQIPPLVNVRILLETPEIYDGQTVKFEGELFGQALRQSHGVWFHLLDEEGSAIGIWAKKEDILPFTYYGKYGVQGDHVILTGVYHKACQTHGGDTDIHLLEINEIKQGHLLEAEQISSFRIYFLITLFLVFVGLLVYISRVAVNKTESQ